MTPEDFPDETKLLCELCHLFGDRGWCRATSGNFSLRVAESYCLISQTGKDKSRLVADDLMICDLDGNSIDERLKPSAETALHACLYGLDEDIGCVLHTHSVTSTVLSQHAGDELRISGFEMQKAFPGISSHEDEIVVRVFDNDQDMQAMAGRVEKARAGSDLGVPGFLIRGHGLYAWGEDAAQARRHIEGFEFLFECKRQEKLAGFS